MNTLHRTIRDTAFRIGLVFWVVGCGPLLVFIAAASFGLTDDTNTNPIGLGLLAMCTFWPGLILMGIGLRNSLRAKGKREG